MNRPDRIADGDFGAVQTSPLINATTTSIACNVNALVIAGDGSVIAAALGDGQIELIKIGEGTLAPPKTVHRHAGAATFIERAGAGFVSGAQDGRIVFGLATGESKPLYDFGGRWVDALAVHEKRGLVAAAAAETVVVVDFNGELLFSRSNYPSSVSGLAFDRAGARLAASHYDGVTVSEIVKPDDDLSLYWKGSHIGLTWSPDDRFITSTTQERELHVWDLVTMQDFRMGGYPRKVLQMDWLEKGPVLACSGADVVTAWPFDGAGPGRRPPFEIGYVFDGTITSVSAHPVGDYVAGGFSTGSVMIGGVTKGEALVAQPAMGSPVTSLSWSSDGANLAAATAHGDISLFHLSDDFDVR